MIGTIGLPGERTFYCQVRQGFDTVSIVVEKQQAAALAEGVTQLLDRVGLVPQTLGVLAVDHDPLDLPIDEEFRLGAVGLAWDPQGARVLLELHAASESEVADIGEDDEDAADTVRIRLTAPAARAFAERAALMVSAGRPPCPLCSLPLDPQGHICPRANGYRRRG